MGDHLVKTQLGCMEEGTLRFDWLGKRGVIGDPRSVSWEDWMKFPAHAVFNIDLERAQIIENQVYVS